MPERRSVKVKGAGKGSLRTVVVPMGRFYSCRSIPKSRDAGLVYQLAQRGTFGATSRRKCCGIYQVENAESRVLLGFRLMSAQDLLISTSQVRALVGEPIPHGFSDSDL